MSAGSDSRTFERGGVPARHVLSFFIHFSSGAGRVQQALSSSLGVH